MAGEVKKVKCRQCGESVSKDKAILDDNKQGYYYCSEECKGEFNKPVESTEEVSAKPETELNATQLLEMLAEMQAEITTLKSGETTTVTKTNDTPLTDRKIRVVSLVGGEMHLTTEPCGRGKPYSFSGYGASRFIRYSDLEDIVSLTYKFAEKGFYYICDAEAVSDLGLDDAYQKIADKKTVDKIMKMDDETCVDLFCSLQPEAQENVSRMLVNMIRQDVAYDLNLLNAIQKRTGIDLIEMGAKVKQADEKK